jgi:hypothetical protein
MTRDDANMLAEKSFEQNQVMDRFVYPAIKRQADRGFTSIRLMQIEELKMFSDGVHCKVVKELEKNGFKTTGSSVTEERLGTRVYWGD